MEEMVPDSSERSEPLEVGGYVLYDEIASGGMAAIHLGRRSGPAGFSKTVAIKRLHAHLARDPEFVAMFLDEARLAARVQHANVVSTLDVVAAKRELFLILEYVHGVSLEWLFRTAQQQGETIPLGITSAVVSDLLVGLDAAHGAVDDTGKPLGIVHRDVSPHNVLVGVDGISRVLDFGVAKAVWRLQSTREGQLKGKLAYMAPETLALEAIDHRADLFAAGVILWEMLTGRRLFKAEAPGAVVHQILSADVRAPSRRNPLVSEDLDHFVLRSLSKNPSQRAATGMEMAMELERLVPPSPRLEVGSWVRRLAGESLEDRERSIASLDRWHDGSRDLSRSGQHLVVPGLSAVLPAGLAVPPTADPSRPATTAGTETDVSASPRPEVSASWPTPAFDPEATTQTDVTEERRGGRLPWRPVVVVAGLVVLGVVTAVALRSGRDEPQPSVASTSADAVAVPAGSRSAAPAASSAAADAGQRAARPRPSATRPPRPTRTQPPARPRPPEAKPDCDPPYTVDKHGAKRFKPACFE